MECDSPRICDSPRVQRAITPSPLCATPTRCREELSVLYPSPPRFLLDALEEEPNTCELPRHFLRDFPFRMVDGRPDSTFAELSSLATYFPGCRGVSFAPPYLVVSWAKKQRKR